jgi:hypothetical protein
MEAPAPIRLEPPAQRTYKLREALLFGGAPQPWRAGIADLAAINPVPGMICGDEARFLHWIARDYFSGQGSIVDLGPLAGGSTHALCSGLALNPRVASGMRVHSYDLWRFEPGWESFFPGERLERGDDVHPLFTKNVQAFGGMVASHPGNLLDLRWNGEPIEILFIDAAKSLELWQHILREFLPRGIPGRMLLVQQDWVCAECPWLHVTTARLSEYLTPVDSPEGGTVVFLLQRPVPRALLEERDFLAGPLPVELERLERAASWTLGWHGLCVRLAQAHYLAMRGRAEEAMGLVEQVLHHPDCTPAVKYDADLVLASIANGERRPAYLSGVKSYLRRLIKGRRTRQSA